MNNLVVNKKTGFNSNINTGKFNKRASANKNSAAWKHNSKQDTVWSCHVFVATALLESEYYRKIGKTINLSEADLFLKHLKKITPSWDAALSFYLAQAVNMSNPRHLEIGHVHESFSLIQKYGLAKEKEINYSPLGIGIPLSMRILRQSVDNIKKGVKEGGSQKDLTKIEIDKIKKNGAFKVLSREGQYFSSREEIKQFAKKYDIKSVSVRHRNNTHALKSMLAHQVVGLNYKVPSMTEELKATHQTHTLIVTGFDEKKQEFTVRDSDSKGLFGSYALTEEFVIKFGTKIYYLEKR